MTDNISTSIRRLRQGAATCRDQLSGQVSAWRRERLPIMRKFWRDQARYTIRIIHIKEADAAKWEAMQ